MKLEPFAEKLKIPVGRLKSYELARAPIRYELADSMCSQFAINQRWLATGKGSKDPYFKVIIHLQMAIPQRELFSVIYDKVLGPLVEDSWKEIAEQAGLDVDSKELSDGLLANHVVPLGAREENSKSYLMQLINERLGLATVGFPPALVHELGDEIDKLMSRITSEHRAEIDMYWRTRSERQQNLERWYRELVEKGLKSKQGIFPYREDVLTYGDVSTYAQGRNETLDLHPMQTTEISKRLKSARESLNLSQSEAASKWGLRLQTLQQWEHGRREPRGLYKDRIEKILSTLEVEKDR